MSLNGLGKQLDGLSRKNRLRVLIDAYKLNPIKTKSGNKAVNKAQEELKQEENK